MTKRFILFFLSIGVLSGGLHDVAVATPVDCNVTKTIKFTAQDAVELVQKIQERIDVSSEDDSVTDTEWQDMKKLHIPENFSMIDKNAFKGRLKNSDIEHVIIPNNVTKIGEGAFSECGKLKSITIPDSVSSIGKGAFDKCFSVNFIVPSNAMRDYLINGHNIKGDKIIVNEKLATQENAWKWKLKPYLGNKKIEISDTVTSIRDGMFKNRTDIKCFVVPDSVASLDISAFEGCSKGRIDFIVPNVQMRDYVEQMFKGHDTLSCEVDIDETLSRQDNNWKWPKNGNIELPVDLKNIDNYMFSKRIDIKSVTKLDNVVSIGESAFSLCSGLESIDLKEGLKTIESNAFGGCKKLKNVIVPTTVTLLGNAAFARCSSLDSIEIKNPDIQIGDKPFIMCKELKSIKVYSDNVKQQIISNMPKIDASIIEVVK